MKHRIFLTFLIGCSLFNLYAQDCDSKLKAARDFKTKKDYKHAIEWYKMVLNDCVDFDEKVYAEFIECEKKTTDKNAPFQLELSSLECSGEGGVLVMDLKKGPGFMGGVAVPGMVASDRCHGGRKKGGVLCQCQSQSANKGGHHSTYV